MIEEVLEMYPEKTKKERAKHLAANNPTEQCSSCQVKSNIKSRPGVMTARGCCAYAGGKVVWGPVKDQVVISHGPVGCGQYSWGSWRNYYNGQTGVDTFGTMHITTDFQEKDIVYGGDKNLHATLHELKGLFPLAKSMSILSECPVGLLGDDIEAVSKKASKELGIPIVPVHCEGFKGMSQYLVHYINDTIRDYILGKGQLDKSTPYDVALIGEDNIGGNAWSSRKMLEEMGLRVITQWTGDTSTNEIGIAHKAKFNLIHFYRSMNFVSTNRVSMNYICSHMEETYGIPWVEFDFFGPTKIYQSIRKIASHFDDRIKENAEKMIAKYKPVMDKIIETYKPRLEGKKVMLYVGDLSPRHTIGAAYEDLGMEVVEYGYEFEHNDDYKRTSSEMKEGVVIMDEATLYEMEEFTMRLRPDMMVGGIKGNYSYHKMGVPFRQMSSWDSGPYHGFDGFPVFARDMDMTVNSPTWDLIRRKR